MTKVKKPVKKVKKKKSAKKKKVKKKAEPKTEREPFLLAEFENQLDDLRLVLNNCSKILYDLTEVLFTRGLDKTILTDKDDLPF